MGLGKKMFLILLAAMVVISAATYGISSLLISRNFEVLEERIVRANLIRIANGVQHQQHHLGSVTNDWANWTSTYQFMNRQYPEYPQEEISEKTFNRYGVDLLLLLDLSGNVTLCRDFGSDEAICANDDVTLVARAIQQRTRSGSGTLEGLLMVRGRPMLISARKILRTDRTGPALGTLAMVTWMNERQVREIAQMLALPMTAVVRSSSEINRVGSNGTEPEQKQWLEATEGEITGFVRVQDVDGGPGIVLSTQFRRDLVRQARVAQQWLLGVIVLVAVLLQGAGYFLLRKVILSRIERLSETAKSIISTGDLSKRAVVSGNDEIAELQNVFNSMMQDLEESRRELLLAQEVLEFHASHDGLTGLLNRAAIMRRLVLEKSRAYREGYPFGLMVIDVDNFKNVNDTYGHAGGDNVLVRVTRNIVQALRPYDIAGRYGGEEFVVIVPGCDEADAIAVAQRVRQQVESAGVLPSVTVSIGLTVGSGREREQELLLAADSALYKAKRSGKNRVEFRRAETVEVSHVLQAEGLRDQHEWDGQIRGQVLQ